MFIHDVADAAGLFKRRQEGESELYPDPVHQASAALNIAAARLVEESGVKTKRPRSPEDVTVSEALQDFGDREETVRKLHDEMFPPAQAGSIGAEQPLDWDSTKEVLAKTIRTERVKALSSDIGHNVSYTYAEGEPVQAFDSGEGSPDTRLDIVARLDMEESRRKDAAIRTREFFAGGVS